MKGYKSRRYKTGEFIWLVELFTKDGLADKIPISINDMLISKISKRTESENVHFALLRAKVVGERKYNTTSYGYRAQFYYENMPVDCYCNNRYKTYLPTNLYGEDYMWVVDEKTTVLVDVRFLMYFIATNERYNELKERVCKGLTKGIE